MTTLKEQLIARVAASYPLNSRQEIESTAQAIEATPGGAMLDATGALRLDENTLLSIAPRMVAPCSGDDDRAKLRRMTIMTAQLSHPGIGQQISAEEARARVKAMPALPADATPAQKHERAAAIMAIFNAAKLDPSTPEVP